MIYMANKIDRNFMKGVLPSYLQPDVTHVNTSNDVSLERTEKEPVSYSGFVKKVKKDNITPENMGEIMLCQIPGISTLYAQAILKNFGNISNLMEKVKDGTATFDNITYEQKGKIRKIPKTCGEEIRRLMSI